MAVVGVAGGQFLGGVISTCMKLKVRGMAKLCMTVSVAMIILNAALWIKCDQEKLAGITLQYSDTLVQYFVILKHFIKLDSLLVIITVQDIYNRYSLVNYVLDPSVYYYDLKKYRSMNI